MTEPTQAPVLPKDADPMVRPNAVPPEEWPEPHKAKAEMMHNSTIMGARAIASKMQEFLMAGLPFVFSEDENLIIQQVENAQPVPPEPEADPDMQT